jgi:hypothetical protein
MNLLKELNQKGFQGEYTLPEVKCKAFEENTGASELARVSGLRPLEPSTSSSHIIILGNT